MRRKELCLFLTFVLLCQPVRIWASEANVNAQAEIQSETETKEDKSEKEDKEETENIQSFLDGMTVGIGTIVDKAEQTDDTNEAKETELNTDETVENVVADDNVENGLEAGSSMDNADAEAVSDTQESDNTSGIAAALGEPVGVSSLVEADKSKEEYAKAYEDAKNANWGYTNLGIANVDNNLNIRAVAAEDGRLVGKLPKDAACEVIDEDGVWAHIKSGKVEGYVSCDYLITGVQAKHRAEELVRTVATVTTDSLKVRAQASTDAEVITLVPKGEQLEVVESEGEWVKVYLDDEEVYVYSEYVEVNAELNTAITMTELLYGQGVSDVRVDLCQYAKEFLGNPYVWGGTSLTKGADCSGFVLSVFKKFGVNLPHYSGSQAGCGTQIKLSEAKPGDLVFYGNGKRINHVAIYIGNGQVIHASSPKTGIKISNATYRSPIKVVRILQD